MLETRFTEPDNFKWGSFKNRDGAKIRYGHIKPDGEPKATMIIGPGFGEPIEKYFETIRDMTDRGFEVWAMEWRGQGGSERYLDDPHKAHHKSFSHDVGDFHQFLTQTVKPNPDKPLILNGHSMGGHIGLRYLHDHPGVFDCALISAPMLGIHTGKFSKSVAKMIIAFARLIGNKTEYVPEGGPFKGPKESFEDNKRCQDKARWKVQYEYYKLKPELQLGDPTYEFVYQSMLSMNCVEPASYLEKITTPILMATPGKDEIVEVEPQVRASRILPNCTRVDFPDAKHEIWLEREDLRSAWLKAVDTFLSDFVSSDPQKNPPPVPPPLSVKGTNLG